MQSHHISGRANQLHIQIIVKVLDFITTAFQFVKIGCRYPYDVT